MADYDGDLALRREQNIERNNKYLQELGLLPKTKTSEKAIKAITTNIWAEDESVTPNKITRLLHRESITDFIFHYYKSSLNEVFPLIISGPDGCGKWSVANEVIKHCPGCRVIFSCEGYNDLRTFLKELWNATMLSIKSYASIQLSGYIDTSLIKKLIDRINDITTPSNFHDFVKYLKFVLNDYGSLFNKNCGGFQVTSIISKWVHFLFRRIDMLDSFEKKFAIKLINLSDLCSITSIRMTATCLAPDQVDDSHELVHAEFGPYSFAQTKQIIINYLREKFPPVSSLAAEKISTHHCPLSSSSSSSSVECTLNCGAPLDMNSIIIQLVDKSLHQLMTFTTNIGVLRQMSLCLLKSVLDTVYPNWSIISKSQFFNTNTTIFADAFESVPMLLPASAIRSAVLHLMANSGVGMVNVSTAPITSDRLSTEHRFSACWEVQHYLPAKRRVEQSYLAEDGLDRLRHMSLSMKYLILAAYIAAANPKESDIRVFMGSAAGRRKQPKRQKTISVHTTNKSRPILDADDTEDRNFVQYDDSNSTLTLQSTGKGGSGNNLKKDQKPLIPPRPFTLERVFAIFGEIACICGLEALNDGERASLALGKSVGTMSLKVTAQDVTRTYGTLHLFAVMRDLINQKLLAPVSSSMDMLTPMLQCRISAALATQVAQSVMFNLQDFILSGSD